MDGQMVKLMEILAMKTEDFSPTLAFKKYIAP